MQFGEKSLASTEYRAMRSAMVSGENNPMFGKQHTVEAKTNISRLNSGKIPHNRGIKVTDEKQLATIKNAIALREENYRKTNYHPRKGAQLTDETKSKISASIKSYAENHPYELISRSKKATRTKESNGFFFDKKEKTQEKNKKKWFDHEYQTIAITDDQITLCHVPCGTQFIRNSKSALNPKVCAVCYPAAGSSAAETEIKNWIQTDLNLSIISGSRDILADGFELDIFIPELKIAIEYNGLYWHSESSGKSKWYHATKYNKCKDLGIRLIQIFEDEWVNKQELVKSRLSHMLNKSSTKVIYARKTIVASIPSALAKAFAEEHHIQGKGTGTICYGLYHDDELISVMDFGKLSAAKGQRDKLGWFELTRFSSKYRVPGGASKLLSKFIKDHQPQHILSYSDLRWNTGNTYQQLGFIESGTTLPNYWYTKGTDRFHRYRFRKDQLVKQGHDVNLTESVIMMNLGYHVIWDCGHTKWIWTDGKSGT
jgi:hypothetical protein